MERLPRPLEPVDDRNFQTFPRFLESIEIDYAHISDATLETLPKDIKQIAIANCPLVTMTQERGAFLFPDANTSRLAVSVDKAKDFREKIQQRLCDQPEATEEAIKTLILATNERKTFSELESVLFCCGPSGVGKTELAKVMASISDRPYFAFHMDQFQESHKVSNLSLGRMKT